jgi:hypothetical protein
MFGILSIDVGRAMPLRACGIVADVHSVVITRDPSVAFLASMTGLTCTK